MANETLQRFTKYADGIKNKLAEKTLPEKQKNRPVQYRQFLERELQAVTAKIDALKMSAPAEAKK
jgi:hypothetical protein